MVTDDILLSRMDLMKQLHDVQSSNNPDVVQKAKNSVLELSVTREEIRIVVWGCGEDKSPGPDRFTFEFFRKL
uniref:RNA-directed DNA polymerase, eukaryota, reverse transcriptase zinc-binding domain protein n=1 Tax=Tanacetum cinerariifolium TaxID=118510 RepID=A0A699VXD6_TANCI|nr:RNA-directed DNA polymerase, eukaryota, reverse transcriptase zinc-binding domain protein [Tanacetum cinerariifolium]